MWRAHVDHAMRTLLEATPEDLQPLIELGLNHEQQHQELLLTDIPDLFAQNPLRPAVRKPNESAVRRTSGSLS